MAGSPRRVAVLGGNRTPFARAHTAYAGSSNRAMLTAAIDGLVDRFGLHGVVLGEVVAGAVLKHPCDYNLTRESVLGSRLDPRTPACDVQQACCTGLEAAIIVANKIALGQIDAGLAGGVDSISDVPLALAPRLRAAVLAAHRARSLPARLWAFSAVRPTDLRPDAPPNWEPRTGLSMHQHAALTAIEWGISRAEQDELAAASHRNLAAALDRGFFDRLVTPYLGLERDNNLRPDTTVETLAALSPLEGTEEVAGLTAGNSTPLSDGASVVLLASEDWAAARGLPVLAWFAGAQTAAVDHVHAGEGLLMAPAYAVPPMLDRAGLTLQDFDLYEINEAYSAQVLSTLRAWADRRFCSDRLGRDRPLGAIDRCRLNINGGALALGHPFGATGGRIVAQTAKALAERESGRALITICAGGGLGAAAILER